METDFFVSSHAARQTTVRVTSVPAPYHTCRPYVGDDDEVEHSHVLKQPCYDLKAALILPYIHMGFYSTPLQPYISPSLLLYNPLSADIYITQQKPFRAEHQASI